MIQTINATRGNVKTIAPFPAPSAKDGLLALLADFVQYVDTYSKPKQTLTRSAKPMFLHLKERQLKCLEQLRKIIDRIKHPNWEPNKGFLSGLKNLLLEIIPDNTSARFIKHIDALVPKVTAISLFYKKHFEL